MALFADVVAAFGCEFGGADGVRLGRTMAALAAYAGLGEGGIGILVMGSFYEDDAGRVLLQAGLFDGATRLGVGEAGEESERVRFGQEGARRLQKEAVKKCYIAFLWSRSRAESAVLARAMPVRA